MEESRDRLGFDKRLLDVLGGMGERNAPLFDGQREMENSPLNELQTVMLVELKIMMQSNIVIVSGSMIHKVNAKGGAFTRHKKRHIHALENSLQSELQHLAELADMLIDLVDRGSKLPERRDSGSRGERVGVER